MAWLLQVVCDKCDYVGSSTPLVGEEELGFHVPTNCPACTYMDGNGKAPQRRASRLKVWRETRRFRKELGASSAPL
jgi:hypothetical protein